MKAMILGIIGLIAAVDVSTDMISPLVEAGSTVILGGILAWLVIKRMPARDREHDAIIATKDILFTNMIRVIADRQHDDSEKFSKILTDLQITLTKN